MNKRKNLAFVVAGKDSVFETYADSENRNFDVFVNYYPEELPPKNFCKYEYFQHRKGIKLKLFKRTVELRYKSLIDDYDYIWFPDDDIASNVYDVNKMFELGKEFNLDAYQPSLTEDSYSSWKFVYQKPDMRLRYTNMIEIMCPCFSKKGLQKTLHSFSWSHSGWGLDWTWPKMLDFKNVGILDEVAVKHTRPVKGGELYSIFKKQNIKPGYKMQKLLNIYNNGEMKNTTFNYIPK